MSSSFTSALYRGQVMHQRLRPRRHRLAYRIFTLLFDIDELPSLARSLRLFSHNRWNLVSFHDRDHGDGSGPLRAYVERQLAEAGMALTGGAIRLLAMPRLLGHVFNPLSVYFCYGPDETLRAILYEVNNTFGQRHSYLLPVAPGATAPLRQSCDKQFYVSPFIAMAMRYRFRVEPPGEHLAIGITVEDTEGPLLHASLRAERAALSDRALLAAFLLYPLLTVKVVAGIHWEALKLFVKGVKLVARPPAPSTSVTHHSPTRPARHDAA